MCLVPLAPWQDSDVAGVLTPHELHVPPGAKRRFSRVFQAKFHLLHLEDGGSYTFRLACLNPGTVATALDPAAKARGQDLRTAFASGAGNVLRSATVVCG